MGFFSKSDEHPDNTVGDETWTDVVRGTGKAFERMPSSEVLRRVDESAKQQRAARDRRN